MSLNDVIRKIITKSNDFCSLCFDVLHSRNVSLEDEVIIHVNHLENNVTMFDVFSTVLGHETVDYISSFDSLCTQCIQIAINSYTFIKRSKENSELVTKVIEGYSNNIDNITHEIYNSKSLYICMNLEDFSINQYCDAKRPVYTATAACRRLKALLNASNIKPKLEVKSVFPYVKEEKSMLRKSKRRSNRAVKIPTVDMMYDKDDQTTIKCKECLKVYPSIWSLRTHYIRVHAPKIYKCTECPRRYGSLTFLENHKVESHCTVVCSECGKVFHNRHTLKMHELGHHMRLVCQKCGRVYKNSATFKKHIEFNVCGSKNRASPADAKFTCDYCNKKYTQKVSLRVHIQYDHGNYKSHDCKWCKKKFWCQSRLKAHIVKHTQEKNFHCTICKSNFVTKESLLYHTRIHTGEKPYECPECDSRFLSASRRAEHVKRHHVGATFECDICHCKFNSQSYLNKHRQTHVKNDKTDNSKLNERMENPKLNDIGGKELLHDYSIVHNFTSVYADDIYLEESNDDDEFKINSVVT